MKRFNRLWKFYLIYSLVFVGVLSLAGFVLQEELKGALQDHLVADMVLLGRVLESQVPDRKDPSALDPFCQSVEKKTGVRVTIVERDGRVIGESNRTALSVQNHLERAEVRDALEGKTGRAIRRSATLGIDMLYVATFFQEKGLVLRLAVPMKRVKVIENEVMFFLVLALYVTPILGIIVAFFFARSLSREAGERKRPARTADLSAHRSPGLGRGTDERWGGKEGGNAG